MNEIIDTNTCSVCLIELDVNTGINICKTLCGHTFHTSCLLQCTLKCPTLNCPLCRANMTNNNNTNADDNDDNDDTTTDGDDNTFDLNGPDLINLPNMHYVEFSFRPIPERDPYEIGIEFNISQQLLICILFEINIMHPEYISFYKYWANHLFKILICIINYFITICKIINGVVLQFNMMYNKYTVSGIG